MSGSLVTIATYPNPIEGEIVCALLCAEGFSAQMANQAMQTAILGAGNPLVRIEVQVPMEEAAEALCCLREQQAAVRLAEEASPPAETDGLDRTGWNNWERLVERAYRWAVLGPFIPVPFVSWYALFCTLGALARQEPLRSSQRNRLGVVVAVSSVASLIWVLLPVVWVFARSRL